MQHPTRLLVLTLAGSLCWATSAPAANPVAQAWRAHRIFTPHELNAFFGQHVIGQEHARKVLAVGAYNHYKRALAREILREGIGKSNIILLGHTGSGKTLLVDTLAIALGAPLVKADATKVTQAGYHGGDVEGILLRLLEKSGWDVQKAQHGIVHIDEIDKIRRKPAESKDIGGEGVQQALLTMMSGATVSLKVKQGQYEMPVSIDTSDILFIVSGAFDGLEKEIAKRTRPGGMGFNAKVRSTKKENLLREAATEDLIAYGLIPEFVGRLPVIATLDTPKQHDLVRIMTEPQSALVKQYQALYASDGHRLTFSDGALEAIADRALAKNTGARGLRSVFEKTLGETSFDLPGQAPQLVEVTTDTIVNGDYPRVTPLPGASAAGDKPAAKEPSPKANPPSNELMERINKKRLNYVKEFLDS